MPRWVEMLSLSLSEAGRSLLLSLMADRAFDLRAVPGIVTVLFTSAISLWGQAAPKATVLTQSPADTKTELQIICLFRPSPDTGLHGSLEEIDSKLGGLLTEIRKPGLFAANWERLCCFGLRQERWERRDF